MSTPDKSANSTVRVGVIGLGYVGLPLAIACARAGKLHRHRRGPGQVPRAFGGEELHSRRAGQRDPASGRLRTVSSSTGTTRPSPGWTWSSSASPRPTHRLSRPTYRTSSPRRTSPHLPLGAANHLAEHHLPRDHRGRRTAYLEKTGLRAGVDFHLAFSPERVDPGKPLHLANTPKVVGGLTPRCAEVAARLLDASRPTCIVSTPRAAEFTKLLENTFRSVNIALVNQGTGALCERMDIDIWEVIDAASSKPFGFMSFTPGPGVGGHCIPVDPDDLSWKDSRIVRVDGMQWPPTPGPGVKGMKPNGLLEAASMTSQMSMPMRSHSSASSLTRAMLTLRKVFSSSLVSSAARGVETMRTSGRDAAPAGGRPARRSRA